MIQIDWATKYFGDNLALDAVAFEALPGQVTALIGPNGAGKTTLFRCLLGLDRLDAGETFFDGVPYAKIKNPGVQVGVMLDSRHGHPGRTALQQLRAQAIGMGVSQNRVYEMLQLVGLESVAKKRIGSFSLGMKQRLGLAIALLGDPQTLVLDEPLNGLDSDGIRWVRNLLRNLADEGRTVLIASHIMSEVEKTADHLVVLGQGKVLADAQIHEILEKRGVYAAATDMSELARIVRRSGFEPVQIGEFIAIAGVTTRAISLLALEHSLILTHLAPRTETVEDAYLRITAEATIFAAKQADSVA